MINDIRKILSGKDCYKNRLNCIDADYTCRDCENKQLSKLIAEHDSELLDKVADMVLSLPKKYIDNFDYVACALILNGLEEMKAEVR